MMNFSHVLSLLSLKLLHHINVFLTESESLFRCWNIKEDKTIPETRTVGSAMLFLMLACS